MTIIGQLFSLYSLTTSGEGLIESRMTPSACLPRQISVSTWSFLDSVANRLITYSVSVERMLCSIPFSISISKVLEKKFATTPMT